MAAAAAATAGAGGVLLAGLAEAACTSRSLCRAGWEDAGGREAPGAVKVAAAAAANEEEEEEEEDAVAAEAAIPNCLPRGAPPCDTDCGGW